MNLIDHSTQPRAGEELDIAMLERHLLERLPGTTGPLMVEQFPSGYSNLTYLIRLGERELVLRRPPFGSRVKTAHDMGREYRILSRLQGVYPPAPCPLLYCDDLNVMGAPFYVMERVRGMILRRDPPQGLDLSPERAQRLGLALIDGLADLHRLDYRAAGLGDLGKPEGYVQRQVSGWTQRYYGSQTDEFPDVDRVIAWLKDRMPPESGAALVHNDYKFDNLVLDPADPARIIGVLDWEMATIGDPLMDLGTTLGYWVEVGDPEDLQQFRLGPTTLPGMPTRRELAERYAERTEADLSRLPFHYVFALFKIAVIVQQIYFRYARGLTRDRRFAPLIHMVRILNREALRAADASGL